MCLPSIAFYSEAFCELLFSNSKQQLGRWGEDRAANFLVKKGYLIIERNARTKYGEIDIIADQEGMTVFVEVKTRSGTNSGYPEDSITYQKRRHLYNSALSYLQANPHLEGDWRIDVIAIRKKFDAPPEIVHFEDAL